MPAAVFERLVHVLRLTSGYMSRTYGDRYRHVTSALKLKRTDPPRAELERKEAILSPAELRALLAWLKPNEPMIHGWAVLQGLCGRGLARSIPQSSRKSLLYDLTESGDQTRRILVAMKSQN